MTKIILKILLVIFLLPVILFACFLMYSKFTDYLLVKAGYHVGEGAIFAESIGKIASDTKNPLECAKIKLSRMAIMMGPHEINLQSLCYNNFAKTNKDISLCQFIPPDQGPGGNSITTPELCRKQAEVNNNK